MRLILTMETETKAFCHFHTNKSLIPFFEKRTEGMKQGRERLTRNKKRMSKKKGKIEKPELKGGNGGKLLI